MEVDEREQAMLLKLGDKTFGLLAGDLELLAEIERRLAAAVGLSLSKMACPSGNAPTRSVVGSKQSDSSVLSAETFASMNG